jgi:hypothetical protein
MMLGPRLLSGPMGDSSFWLLVALWASFGLGYAYNAVRH